MRKHIIGGLALFLGAVLMPEATHAVTVNCNMGKKISNALALGAKDITVVGTCTESVEIRRDDVIIQGSAGATVVGELFVNAARRITIKNLHIQGGTPGPEGINGISARDGASITVKNVLIENVEGNGILLDRSASGVLDGVTVQSAIEGVYATGHSYVEFRNGSFSQNNIELGVWVDLGSAGIVSGSTVQNNPDGGVLASRGASIVLEGNTIANNVVGVTGIENSHVRLTGNLITGEGEALLLRGGSTARLRGGGNILTSPEDVHAINLKLGTMLQQDRGHDTVTGLVGIFGADFASFEDVEIHGSMGVQSHSTLLFNARSPGAGIQVTGGVGLGQDSSLLLEGSEAIEINGGIGCEDSESSVTTPFPDNVDVPGGVDCTGFNQ